jgi:hypothetical protein
MGNINAMGNTNNGQYHRWAILTRWAIPPMGNTNAMGNTGVSVARRQYCPPL